MSDSTRPTSDLVTDDMVEMMWDTLADHGVRMDQDDDRDAAQFALEAAVELMPTVDGWVWCDYFTTTVPVSHCSSSCPGPHWPLAKVQRP